MPFVVLQSSDNKNFYIETEVANHCGTLKNLLSLCGTDSEREGIIPLPNVDEDTLRRVLDWIDHYKNAPIFNKDECSTFNITPWDKEFLNVRKEILFKLIIAANYLDIPGLMYVTSREIARMMEGKTPQEIRDTFNIRNDFSPEEEQRIWLENNWFTKDK